MRTRIATMLALALVAACGGGEEEAPMEEPAVAEEAQAMTSVEDFAGTWRTTSVIEGTPDPVPSTLQGSADGTEWTMMLEGRDPIALTASMSGDSLVLVSEPYESVLRDGVTVTVRTAGVLEDGRMVGTMTATYRTADGEEVVNGTIEGTRAGM